MLAGARTSAGIRASLSSFRTWQRCNSVHHKAHELIHTLTRAFRTPLQLVSKIKSIPLLLPRTSVNYLASIPTVQSQLHRSTAFVNSWCLTDPYVNVGYLRPRA